MKKVLIALAIVGMFAIASCGSGKTESNTNKNDSTQVDTAKVVTDTTGIDSVSKK